MWYQLDHMPINSTSFKTENRASISLVNFSYKTTSLSLPSVFCCRAGSGYPNGYPVLGNSRGGFPLPSSRLMITYCDQSFPSPWHCLSAAPSLSGATLLSTLEGIPLSATWGRNICSNNLKGTKTQSKQTKLKPGSSSFIWQIEHMLVATGKQRGHSHVYDADNLLSEYEVR